MSSSIPCSSNSPSLPTKFQNFGAPFAASDADIIVRSSDGYDFRVHRVILGLASVAFKDMFSMVQQHPVLAEQNDELSDDFKDGLPVVCLTEPSSTLFTLFKLIYPGDPPTISGRSHTISVIRAMDKYLIEDYPNTITAALLNLSEKSPHVVLGLAFRHHIAKEVRVEAAHFTLKSHAILSSSALSDEDLELLTAAQYRRILVYHRDCSQAALSALAKPDWAKKPWAQASCGKEKQGVAKWGDSPSGCICIRSSHKIEVPGPLPSGQVRKRHIYVPEWTSHFISRCEAVARDTPHWNIVSNVSIRSSAAKADSCDMCASRASEELDNLAAYFAKHIRRSIEQNYLQIELPV
ncbi:uncharacterized protein STEHIDRAFT_168099 [Stereum hirsutum FP-91666 SS1]|uniref:uncharacterized protein n=1 Tax=Stereum hirsutum (strain FP-91666) TaxID=721885 RepID=UPI000440F65B|nr:uncharacterized protein STEHIDRAFT_168099 [Stereum hirsutum FP-91666 SS1]EIM87315.1 hypothetical protein STEHIDRAFT_168099 [Stereum hirsutum FP-91666 SS1]